MDLKASSDKGKKKDYSDVDYMQKAQEAMEFVEKRPDDVVELKLPPYLKSDVDRVEAEKSGRVLNKTRERIRAAIHQKNKM